MSGLLGVPSESAWDLDQVVQGLRRSRIARNGVESPQRERHKLPSRAALERVTTGLTSALFPSHFGPTDLTPERIDYFVGDVLGTAFRVLESQVLCELDYASPTTPGNPERASALTRNFAERLPAVHELLETDVRAAFEGDPAARSLDEALFCYPGVTAILHHRLAHELYRLGLPLLARIISEIAHSATGIDIHPGADIGRSFFIDHGTGVVIGETAVVGDRVRLYQGVTLGAKSFPLDERGVALKGKERHPIVEEDVVIYAGATILGRITIGRGSTIGGNVWLTRSVPPGSRVTQAQARSDVYSDGGGI
ncbi:MAG TPA: serine O-acetyltransferase EpsC [Polyangiaceae bacterium]|nr:serine O-acetyltransferase EpsC [Polyangiaceae bacterium]